MKKLMLAVAVVMALMGCGKTVNNPVSYLKEIDTTQSLYVIRFVIKDSATIKTTRPSMGAGGGVDTVTVKINFTTFPNFISDTMYYRASSISNSRCNISHDTIYGVNFGDTGTVEFEKINIITLKKHLQ